MPWSRQKAPGTTKASGYDKTHQKIRAIAAARHRPDDPCVRCGHALGPMGPWLHLDHTNDRSGYLGFSHGSPCPVCHKKCNLRAAALKAKRIQARSARRKTPTIIDRW